MADCDANNLSFPVEAALRILADLRSESDVVVTNQGSARLWPRFSQHTGDFNYNPSTMGGAIPLALGIALACPAREVIVLSGDGSLLMNLGCLVTVIDSRATNLSVILLNNGLYEVTGGQLIAAKRACTDFGGIARAVGFQTVGNFSDQLAWQAQAAKILGQPGPRFISLRVSAMVTDCLNDATEPMAQQIQRLTSFLPVGGL